MEVNGRGRQAGLIAWQVERERERELDARLGGTLY